MSRFKLLAVIDEFQENLWAALELELGLNQCGQVAEWMMQQTGHNEDGDEFDELPVYDEIVDEDGDYLIAYHDLGMCQSVYLYRKI